MVSLLDDALLLREPSITRCLRAGEPIVLARFSSYWPDGRRRWINGVAQGHDEEAERLAVSRARASLVRALAEQRTEPRRLSPLLSEFAERCWSVRSLDKSTVAKYRQTFKNHVNPFLGELRLSELTDSVVSRWFEGRRQVVGPAALVHCYRDFKSVLEYAVRAGEIPHNPMRAIPSPKRPNLVHADDVELYTRRRNLWFGLLRRIEDGSLPQFEYALPLFVMMSYGLRRSELLAVSWGQLRSLNSRNKAYVLVDRQLKFESGKGWFVDRGSGGRAGTKNGAARRVPLSEEHRVLFRRLKTACDSPDADSFVFVNPHSGRHYTYNAFQSVFESALFEYYRMGKDRSERSFQQFKDEGYYFRPHFVRHLALSEMLAGGVSAEVAREIIGDTPDVALHYTKVSQERAADEIERFGSQFKARRV